MIPILQMSKLRLREGMSYPKAARLEVTEYQENSGLLPGLIKVQPLPVPAPPSLLV